MSLFSGSNISELFVGESKIGSVFVGENCVYQSNYEIPIEEDNGNEYFYFRVHDKRETAQVGFERRTSEYHPSEATTIPTINYSSFTTYVAPTFEYSYDKITWNPYTLGTLLSIGNGQVANKVYFRGDNSAPWYDEYQQTTTHLDSNNKEVTDTHMFRINTHAIINNAQIQCNGNIMSLRYKNHQNQLTIPCDYAFMFLFDDCVNILRGPVLAATTLAPYCYARLFSGCTSLSFAPNLPATVMQEGCYASMFNTCRALKIAPSLPAMTLASGCYGVMSEFIQNNYVGLKGTCNTTSWIVDGGEGMFGHCISLTIAPELPATTLANYCYGGMFGFCNSLTIAPELPATTLAEYCYNSMFLYCSSLTDAPELPATTLAHCCYGGFMGADGMFGGCTSLVTAPKLSATTLAQGCYEGMFYNCHSLTIAPELPATTLAEYCYEGMFAYSGIMKTPKLSATTLVGNCYGTWIGTGMFQGCKNLTSITTLPATTIADNAYYNIFKQSNVKASATQTTECKYAYRVPTSGTGSADSKSLTDMFTDASDTTKNFTPSVNTTFYINVPSF